MKRYFIIFDNNCPLCLKGVKRLINIDYDSEVRFIPLSNIDSIIINNIPKKNDLHQSIHLIGPDGKQYKGAEAISRLLLLSSKSKFKGKLLLLPVIKPIAKLIYALVAKYRYKLS